MSKEDPIREGNADNPSGLLAGSTASRFLTAEENEEFDRLTRMTLGESSNFRVSGFYD